MFETRTARAATAGAALALLVAGGAVAAEDETILVSSTHTGAASTAPSLLRHRDAMTRGDQNAVSDDGRYVVFQSSAALVDGVAGGVMRIYRRDLQTATRVLVSRTSDDAPAEDDSQNPSISGDGRYVAFESLANVFVRDIQDGTTIRVSGQAHNPSISGNGLYVAFQSSATDLVEGDGNGATDIFRWSRASRATERVSLGDGDVEASGASFRASISDDGNRVAFLSGAANMSVENDENSTSDAYVRDVAQRTTHLASRAVAPHADVVFDVSLSGDGRFVTFDSGDDNLSLLDSNAHHNIFVRDLESGSTELVSRGSDGSPATGHSYAPAISRTGRYVAYATEAGNAVAGAITSWSKIVVRDRVAGANFLASRTSGLAGLPADSVSRDPSVSADARIVAFESEADNLSLLDNDQVSDIFAREFDRSPPDTGIEGGPSGLSNLPGPTFTFTSNELSVTFECSLNGDPFGGCRGIGRLGDGTYTLQVRAIDDAYNVDPTPASRQWSIDTAAPETAIVTGPPTPTHEATATFGFAISEPGTFECRLDAADFADCGTALTRTIGDVHDGSHTFEVRARDLAGNLDATPASYTWIVDRTPPDTVITGGPEGLTADATPTFTFASSELGVTFQCRLDAAPFGSCTGPASFDTGQLPDGAHVVHVRAIDALGNADPTPAERAFGVDSLLDPASPFPPAGCVQVTPKLQRAIAQGMVADVRKRVRAELLDRLGRRLTSTLAPIVNARFDETIGKALDDEIAGAVDRALRPLDKVFVKASDLERRIRRELDLVLRPGEDIVRKFRRRLQERVKRKATGVALGKAVNTAIRDVNDQIPKTTDKVLKKLRLKKRKRTSPPPPPLCADHDGIGR